MKKTVKVLLIVGVAALTLTGCGTKADKKPGYVAPPVIEVPVVPPVVEEPVVDQPLIEEPVEEIPVVEVPAEPVGKEMIIVGVHEAIKGELGDNYIPSMEMDIELLEGIYGVNPEDVLDFIGEMPMMSTHVDTFIAVKALEGKADAVEESLTKYREYLIENSMQYPMNMAKVNAAEVVRHGDEVYFILLGAFDERADVDEGEQLKFAKEEIQKVKDIIASFY